MGRLNVLTSDGDITIEWKAEDDESVKKAKDEWHRLAEAGFEFFKPADGGGKGRRLKKFNKDLGWVIAAPGVQTEQDKQEGKRKEAMAGGPNDAVLRVSPIR